MAGMKQDTQSKGVRGLRHFSIVQHEKRNGVRRRKKRKGEEEENYNDYKRSSSST